jgi:hypothetical protein
VDRNSQGWAVKLVGDQFDIDALKDMLLPPFDPWVEDYHEGDSAIVLLRRDAWTSFSEAVDVLLDANRLLDQLNGAILLTYQDATPVTTGRVFKFSADGTPQPFIFATTGHASMTLRGMRLKATAVTSGPPAPPRASILQERIKAAESDDVRATLLVHLFHANNWFDLYKAIELLREVASQGAGLASIPDFSQSRLDKCRRTANYHRHAPGLKNSLPHSPPTFEEARAYVLTLVSHIL